MGAQGWRDERAGAGAADGDRQQPAHLQGAALPDPSTQEPGINIVYTTLGLHALCSTVIVGNHAGSRVVAGSSKVCCNISEVDAQRHRMINRWIGNIMGVAGGVCNTLSLF